MEIQLINFSSQNFFNKFSHRYNIFKEEFQPGIFGIEIRNISLNLSAMLKEVFNSANALCYTSYLINGEIDLLIIGAFNDLKKLTKNIFSKENKDLGHKIFTLINNYENYNYLKYKIGNKEFDFQYPYLMGILNVTPDSFSDGGLYLNEDDAVHHAIEMLDSGADIIDIGAESTRPGSDRVSSDDELKRLIPVIKEILIQRKDAIISVDTTKEIVAEKALASGAKIINDISGLTFESSILNVVKEQDAALVIMHIKGTPKNMQLNPKYDDVVKEVYNFLSDKVLLAKRKGVEKIFIDPGIGFGKRLEDNINLINRLEDLKCIGTPILIGVSRKSFLGHMIDADVNSRDTATSIVEAVAIKNGAKVIRTHNTGNGIQVNKIMNFLN